MEKTHVLHHNAAVSATRPLGLRDIPIENERVPCEVFGSLPLWLKGDFYAQSSGAFGDFGRNEFKPTDVLDGLAHAAAFHIDNGSAFFSNKFMRSSAYLAFSKTGERVWGGSAVDAVDQDKNLVKLAPYKGMNPNVTFWRFNDGKSIASTTEADGEICVFDKDSLTTLPSFNPLQLDTSESFKTIITTSSHFFREGAKGGHHVALELGVSNDGYFSFTYDIFYGDAKQGQSFDLVAQYQVTRFKVKKIPQVNQKTSERAAYMHTVAKSANYLVLIAGSNRWDYIKLLGKDFSGGFFNMFPKLDHPMEFLVFKTEGKSCVFHGKFTSNYVGTAFHVGNCFEEGHNLVLEVTTTSDYLDPLASGYIRFSMDLSKPDKMVAAEYLYQNYSGKGVFPGLHDVRQFEFVNINPRFHQKSHRYVFGVVNAYSPDSALVRMDVRQGREGFVACKELQQARYFPAEPIVVAHPFGRSELDAVVLSIVLDKETKLSYLFCVDANTMQVICTLKAPLACNFGIHSVWCGNTPTELNHIVSKY